MFLIHPTFIPAVSVRAYGAQALFRDRLKRRVNVLMRCSLSFYDINRWISVRIDTLSGIFAATVSAYFVYANGITAGYAGFTLSLVLGLSRDVLFWVRIYNLLEIEGKLHCIDLGRTITLIWNTQIQRTGMLSRSSRDTKAF